VEAIGDVVLRAAPIGPEEAHRMIRELRGRKILEGFRGAPPADTEALVDALVQLSRLAAAQGDRLASLDINPFVVLPRGRGALALDAAIVPR